jgi:signal transduction histidine kinase/ActR/RegA family two-component response regulator
MVDGIRSGCLRYGLAFLALFGAAVFLRIPTVADAEGTVAIVAMLAVMVVARWGGTGPALFLTSLIVLLTFPTDLRPGKVVRLVLFISGGVSISLMIGALCASRGRAQRDVAHLKLRRDELTRAKDVAESAGRSRDLFMAMLSHELRTPLTPALLIASGLLDDSDTPPALREPLEIIRRSIALAARLVDDLLDATRAVVGKFQLSLERIDAHEVVREALAMCENDIAEAGVRLVVDLSASRSTLEADSTRLQQVIWNLVRNACKFTPRRGSVFVRTRLAEGPDRGHLNSKLIVEVADTGSGIEPEDLPRIFEPFEQVGTGTERLAGLGLGLAIARSIAKAHGGCLRASSEGLGKGTSLTLELPLAALPDPPPTDPQSTVPREIRRCLRILLVEDDPATSQVLTRSLRRRSHEVVTAATVAAGLAAAELHQFDILISDLGLPDGTGWDLMNRLRERHAVAGIALTGFGTRDDQRKTQEAGFADHLTKPVEIADLEAAIQRVVVRCNETRREDSTPVVLGEPPGCPAWGTGPS